MSSTQRTPAEAVEAVLERLTLTASQFAALIDVSPQLVSFIRAGKRAVPPDKVPLICSLVNGEAKRWELRPEDWHSIWPDLIGTEGAPPIAEPATKQEAA